MSILHLNLMKRGWYADEPLWVVFWVYGVALSFVLAGALLGPALVGKVSLLHYVTAVCVLGVYTEWILTSIWHCAGRVTRPEWGAAARLLTVAWAINLVLMLVFLGATAIAW